MVSHFQQVQSLRILLIDHQVLFREGLISMLQNEPDIEIVGEVGNARDGFEKAIELKPDLILMEINLPDEDGLKLTKQILSQLPQIKIVILTIYNSFDFMLTALLSGAKGYLAKNTPIKNVLASLRAVVQGELALNRSAMPTILEEFIRLERAVSLYKIGDRNINISAGLTTREIEVLRLLTTDASNREIAKQLFISENTVKVHVSKILVKLKYKSRGEAAEFARRYGLTSASVDFNPEFLAFKPK
jgi:DNA-binding NarL/FixJ family response regulator